MALSAATVQQVVDDYDSSRVAADPTGYGSLSGAQRTVIKDALKDLVQPIYDQLVADGLTTSTVTVTSVSGVTVGAGVSGPGTGTATGGIT